MAHLFLSPLMSIIDDTGAPLAGGTMEFYEGNTTTPKAVYLDDSLTTSAGTTITLTPEGRTGDSDGDPAAIFMPSGQYYKIVTKDSLGNIIPVAGYTNYFTGTDSATSINTITTDTTINVPADYATEQEAWEYLADITIAPNVTVTINIAAGSYTHDAAMRPHPQGNQIVAKGTTVTYPVEADFVVTGYSSGARATDNANHIAMLKSKFGAEIICDDCGFYDGRSGAVHPTFQNMLVYKPAAAADYQQDVAHYLYGGLQYMDRMSFHGFDLGVVGTSGGQLRGGTPFSASSTIGYISFSGMGGFGYQMSDHSAFKYINTIFCISNTSTGAFHKRNAGGESYGIVIKGNGGHGLTFENGGGCVEASHAIIKMNAFTGVKTVFGGQLQVDSAVVQDNGQYGMYANGGIIMATTATVSGNVSGGAISDDGGRIDLTNGTIESNTVFGVKSQGAGSSLDCSSATIRNNGQVGVSADYGATIYAISAIVYGNASQGFLATNAAKIIANSAQSYGNSGAGVDAEHEAVIIFQSGTCGTSGNPNANGMMARYGGRIDGTDATCKYNTGRGLYVIRRGIIDLGASSSAGNLSNNTGAEIEATVDAAVYIANITGLSSSDISGEWDQANSVVYAPNTSFHRGSVGADTTCVIAGGVITPTSEHITIDTEGSAATDDLDTITVQFEGQKLRLRIISASRVPTIKNGTGNIDCGADIPVAKITSIVDLYAYSSTRWMVVNYRAN